MTLRLVAQAPRLSADPHGDTEVRVATWPHFQEFRLQAGIALKLIAFYWLDDGMCLWTKELEAVPCFPIGIQCLRCPMNTESQWTTQSEDTTSTLHLWPMAPEATLADQIRACWENRKKVMRCQETQMTKKLYHTLARALPCICWKKDKVLTHQ